jgi:hypothetical protein
LKAPGLLSPLRKGRLRLALLGASHPRPWSRVPARLELRNIGAQEAGRLHMRTDEDNRRLWEAEARSLGMSLSMWIECVCNREAENRRRQRLLDQMYPQKKASRSA